MYASMMTRMKGLEKQKSRPRRMTVILLLTAYIGVEAVRKKLLVNPSLASKIIRRDQRWHIDCPSLSQIAPDSISVDR
jgi:hypothetical protein